MQVLDGLHLWQNPSTQFWILMLKALNVKASKMESVFQESEV